MIYNDIRKLTSSTEIFRSLISQKNSIINNLSEISNSYSNIVGDDVQRKNVQELEKVVKLLEESLVNFDVIPEYCDVVLNKATEYLNLANASLDIESVGASEILLDSDMIEISNDEVIVNPYTGEDGNIISDFNTITANWNDAVKEKLIQENIVSNIAQTDYSINVAFQSLYAILDNFNDEIDKFGRNN